MSFATSTPIQYRLYGDASAASGDQSHQVLEVQLRCFRRLIYARVPPRILHETAPTPLNNAVFHLSLRQLQDPLLHVAQFLSSLNIRATACEVMAPHIASCIIQMAGGNRDTNFHIVAVVDYIRQITWMEPIPVWMEPIPVLYLGRNNGGASVEETVVVEEAPPAMEKLEENNGEEFEELGDCSICLDEMNCKKSEVVKIRCGHVYHQSCIFKWLRNSNSCPLCRRPVSLED